MTNYIPSDEELAKCAAALPQVDESADHIEICLPKAV